MIVSGGVVGVDNVRLEVQAGCCPDGAVPRGTPVQARVLLKVPAEVMLDEEGVHDLIVLLSKALMDGTWQAAAIALD